VNFLRRKQPAVTNEISHADASARVDTLRAELDSINADLAAARQHRDDHECNAVLAGAEIDISFRAAVDELQAKSSVTSNLIRTLEVRVEAIRQKEAEAELATRRAAAEELIRNLMAKQREKAAAAIAAVFACNNLFLEAAEIRKQILGTITVEFPGESRTVPPLPPSGPLTFFKELSLDTWCEGACEFGYSDLIPDSMAAKRRYLNKHGATAPSDQGANAAEASEPTELLISS
jgi:hypothetical protein